MSEKDEVVENDEAEIEITLEEDTEEVALDIGDDEEGEEAPPKEEASEADDEEGDEGEEETADGEEEGFSPEDDVTEDDLTEQGYTKKVSKRIMREVRLRRDAEAAAAQAVEAARVRDAEARNLRQQYLRLQHGYATVIEGAYKDRIETKTEKLKLARQESDLDKETELQSEIDDLRFKLNQVRDTAARLPKVEEAATETQQQAQPEKPNVEADKWLARNAWFGKPQFQRQRRAALLIDQELAAEGVDKTSPAYFKELDKRLQEQFPNFRKKPTKQKEVTQKQPVAAVSRGAGPKKPSGSKVVITPEDKRVMRQFGLDPTNKEHLVEFARNKRAVA